MPSLGLWTDLRTCIGAPLWQVYEEAKELLQMSMDGFNVCFFAYGQTGSGKTHTILGSPDNEGILPRVVKDVFDFSRFGGLKVRRAVEPAAAKPPTPPPSFGQVA